MISTGIYDSSVAWNLGQKNPGFKGLAAQRILEVLIFLADDYGRGRYIPGMIRSRAFSSIPEVLNDVTKEDVEAWLKQIEEEGTLQTYEVDGQKYYTLTGWRHYQRGKWRPGRSSIPPPPWEENESSPDDADDTQTDKSQLKSQLKSSRKSAPEVDTEVVTEKKRRERKEREKKSANDEPQPEGDQQPRTVGGMLRDPDVPDSEAVAAGCDSLPDPEPYGETRLRQAEQGHQTTPGDDRETQEP